MTRLVAPVPVALVPPVSNLLSLDQASRVSGWAVFEDNTLKAWGHFTVDDEDMGKRLTKIREKVIALMEKFSIDEVAYEDIQLQSNVGNNVHTFKILAEVYGVITQLCDERAIPATSYLAVTWKSTLGIKGRDRAAQKRAAQAYVLDKYGAKCTQDEADAICIGASVRKIDRAESFDWS